MAANPAGLERFVAAQEPVYPMVLRELRASRKETHWMWFIFPQVAGLGSSEMARRFAISSRSEAALYLEHPLLGSRLRECTQLMLDAGSRSATQILGEPDDLKFCSSMTLFSIVSPEEKLFAAALAKYFNGNPDQRTVKFLNEPGFR